MTSELDRALRRRDLLLLGAGALGGAVLSGCSSGGGTGTGTGSGGAAGDKGEPLPVTVARKQIAGAHLSADPAIPPAFEKLPRPGYRSVPRTPGSGGDVTSFTITWGAPPTPLEHNIWHQAVNKALGVNLKTTIVPAQSYGEKLVTTIASGNLPDIVTNEPSYRGRAARKFLPQGVFYDLREFLGGDKVKKYANLALVPQYAWKNSRISGAVYGVPCYRPQAIGGTVTYRQDWAEKGGMPDKPTNVDELFAWLKAMKTGGGPNTYPIATIDVAFSFCGAQVYRAPVNWRLHKDGSLTKDLETEEYEHALAFAVKLWKAGLIHPDVLTLTPNPAQYHGYWTAGRIAILNINGPEQYYGATGARREIAGRDPKAKTDVLVPPGFDGGLGVVPADLGYYGMLSIPTSVKDKGRVEELLRVIDYLAAPLGSREWFLTHMGVEGHQWSYDKSGAPVASADPKMGAESFLSLMAIPGIGYYFPNAPGDAVKAQQLVEDMSKAFAQDPTAGIDSATYFTKGDALSAMVQDYTNGIITGRRPISELTEMRKRWRSGGGDQIRSELEKGLAAEKTARKGTS